MTGFATFSEWLTAQMADHQMSQSDLAQALGLKSSSSISRWIAFGARPDPGICEALADLFDADVLAVLRLVGHLRPRPPGTLAEDAVGYESRDVLERRAVSLIRQMPPDLAERWLRQAHAFID